MMLPMQYATQFSSLKAYPGAYEPLGAGKGAGLLDQRVSKCGLIEKSLETLENGSQRPGFEVTVDRTDERIYSGLQMNR